MKISETAELGILAETGKTDQRTGVSLCVCVCVCVVILLYETPLSFRPKIDKHSLNLDRQLKAFYYALEMHEEMSSLHAEFGCAYCTVHI